MTGVCVKLAISSSTTRSSPIVRESSVTSASSGQLGMK
jgi:hypothetical protein